MTRRLNSFLILLLVSMVIACGRSSTPTPSSVMTPSSTNRNGPGVPPAPVDSPTPAAVYDVPLPPMTATAAAMQTAAAKSLPEQGDGSTKGDLRVTILHTNDSRGYVDPCG